MPFIAIDLSCRWQCQFSAKIGKVNSDTLHNENSIEVDSFIFLLDLKGLNILKSSALNKRSKIQSSSTNRGFLISLIKCWLLCLDTLSRSLCLDSLSRSLYLDKFSGLIFQVEWLIMRTSSQVLERTIKTEPIKKLLLVKSRLFIVSF